jgi:hypothetical protein
MPVNNTIEWGQGASNNDIGWGQGAASNSIGWGQGHLYAFGSTFLYGYPETNTYGNFDQTPWNVYGEVWQAITTNWENS